MSFLALINKKREQLKPSQTTVTYPDGQCYIESRSSALPLEIKNKPYGYVVDNKPDDTPAKILDYIYLGSQDCCSQDVLVKYDILNVLSIGIEAPCVYSEIKYYFYECLDLPETSIWEIIKSCAVVIRNSVSECKNILVHCNAGVSRSPSIVIGYLLLEHGFDYEKAFEQVYTARPCIKLNDGFLRQLKEYHLYI